MAKNRKVFDGIIFLMAFLLICSLAVSVAGFLLFKRERERNIKLENLNLLLERNMINYKDSAKRYQEFKAETEMLKESTLDYLQWQFVLKEQVNQAGERLAEDIKLNQKLKNNKELSGLLYYNLGLNYSLAMNFEAAINAYEEALRFNPNDFQSCYNLGVLYSTCRKDGLKAVKYYKKYLELAPLNSFAEEVQARINSLQQKWGPE